MRILALSLADDSRRFIRGMPPKGARIFLNPDLEIAGLMTRFGPRHFHYEDEKVEPLNLSVPFDAALVSGDFWQEPRIREVTQDVHRRDKPVILFGPLATTFPEEFTSVVDSVVVGSILNAWPKVEQDLRAASLQSLYRASKEPSYAPPNLDHTLKPNYDPTFQCMRATIGCNCPESVRPYCRQYLYFGSNLRSRSIEELIGEVIELRRKHIFLIDDDVAADPAYYGEFFTRARRYQREWTVWAGDSVLGKADYLRLLAKAGVRVLYLNESWLSQERLLTAVHNPVMLRQLRTGVRLLHQQRLLVGSRVALYRRPGEEFDFASISQVIKSLNIDFLRVRFFEPSRGSQFGGNKVPAHQQAFVTYQPGLTPNRETWLKHEFYDMGSILTRGLRRPVRVGFYSTFRYYFPRSFAYRQNFLEGIAYPP
ncbi:MAG: hypothetical protein ABIK62_03690 [candidate division WOR-3 bacterium]